MDIIKYDVYRGPNLGVYISVNDDVALIPLGFAESKAEKFAKYLDVDYLYTSIANTRLIGALSVMNNKGILLPNTAYVEEYDFLKKEINLEVGVVDSKFNALGNLICTNDKGAVVSQLFSEEDCQTIKKVLGVEIIKKRIAGFNQVGSVMSANNTGSVIHPETDEKDMKSFANLLGVNIEHSSINAGVPYVSSGILVNNHNLVVGSLTTGPEIMMLTKAFLN